MRSKLITVTILILITSISYVRYKWDDITYAEESEIVDANGSFLMYYPYMKASFPDQKEVFIDLYIEVKIDYLNDRICGRDKLQSKLNAVTLPGNIEKNVLKGASKNWPFLESFIDDILYSNKNAITTVQYFKSDALSYNAECKKHNCIELIMNDDTNKIDCFNYTKNKFNLADSNRVKFIYMHK